MRSFQSKTKLIKLIVLFLIAGLLLMTSSKANAQTSVDSLVLKNYNFRVISEFGFLAAMSHSVQFGQNGTYFSYTKNGGQDVLFPIQRYSLELDYKKRNTWIFLYQPLRLQSQVYLVNDLIVDNEIFPAGSSVNLLYNFPFFRFSYLRELAPKNPSFDFGIGASLQIRNATISFESTDGTRLRTNRDVGPVPALKVRAKKQLTPFAYVEFEADGMYAPVSYLNGDNNDVVGAIVDASLRGGFKVSKPIKAFLNLRYLAGGASGMSDNPTPPSDGFTENWLNFGTVTAGFIYEW